MAFGRNVDPIKRNRPLPARDLERTSRNASSAQRLRVGNGLSQSTVTGIPTIRLTQAGPLYDVKTSSVWPARASGSDQMATGKFRFLQASPTGLLADAGLPEQDGFHVLGVPIPSGARGTVVRISGTWRMISADCSGVA